MTKACGMYQLTIMNTFELKQRVVELEDKIEDMDSHTEGGSTTSTDDSTLDVKKVFNGLSEEVSELRDKLDKVGEDLTFLDDHSKETEQFLGELANCIEDLEDAQTNTAEAIDNIQKTLDQQGNSIENLEAGPETPDRNPVPEGGASTASTDDEDDEDDIPEV